MGPFLRGERPNNSRRYYYNHNRQVLCDYNDSDVFQRWYAYGNYIDEVVMTGTTTLFLSARFYIHDHLYSPAALVDSSGSVLKRSKTSLLKFFSARRQPYSQE